MENRLRWNGAVYLEKWQDFQVGLLGANGLTEIRNAGAAEVKGVETDLNWAIAQGWTLNASGAYTSAHLTEDFCEDLVNGEQHRLHRTGRAGRLGAADHAQAEVQPDLALRVGHRRPAGPRPGFGGLSERQLDRPAARRARDHRPPERLHDRRLHGRVARDSWTLEAYVKNAFDKRASLYRYAECIETVCGGRPTWCPISRG
jgi:iron complex outermembrane receptor protein